MNKNHISRILGRLLCLISLETCATFRIEFVQFVPNDMKATSNVIRAIRVIRGE